MLNRLWSKWRLLLLFGFRFRLGIDIRKHMRQTLALDSFLALFSLFPLSRRLFPLASILGLSLRTPTPLLRFLPMRFVDLRESLTRAKSLKCWVISCPEIFSQLIIPTLPPY